MPTPNPLLLIAELTYRCPLHCPYCSNPLELGASRVRRGALDRGVGARLREAAALGVLQLALTGGEPLVRKDIEELARVAARRRPLQHPRDRRHAVHAHAAPRRCGRRGSTTSRSASRTATRVASDAIAGTSAFARKLEAARPGARARLPAHDQRRPPPPQPRPDRGDHRAGRGARRPAARAGQHPVPGLGGAQPRRADAHARAARGAARRRSPAARERLGPRMEILWVLPDYYEELPEALHGRLGARGDPGQPVRRGAPLPGGGDDPGPRVRQRPRPLARARSGSSRRRSSASAAPTGCPSPAAAARSTARSSRLRRLPLPGARAHRRCRGDRPGVPPLAPPRPDRGARAKARRAAG